MDSQTEILLNALVSGSSGTSAIPDTSTGLQSTPDSQTFTIDLTTDITDIIHSTTENNNTVTLHAGGDDREGHRIETVVGNRNSVFQPSEEHPVHPNSNDYQAARFNPPSPVCYATTGTPERGLIRNTTYYSVTADENRTIAPKQAANIATGILLHISDTVSITCEDRSGRFDVIGLLLEDRDMGALSVVIHNRDESTPLHITRGTIIGHLQFSQVTFPAPQRVNSQLLGDFVDSMIRFRRTQNPPIFPRFFPSTAFPRVIQPSVTSFGDDVALQSSVVQSSGNGNIPDSLINLQDDQPNKEQDKPSTTNTQPSRTGDTTSDSSDSFPPIIKRNKIDM